MTRGILILALVLAASRPSAQTPQKLEYDTFCKLPDVESKRQAFLATTPENRVELARTQTERWRDANKARLKPAQLTALANVIAAFTTELYSEGPKAEAARSAMREATRGLGEIFSREDVQAMQPGGPCIAKAK